MNNEERRCCGRQPLPIDARRAIWRRLWDRLLAPADLRDPDEVPTHERKDASPNGPDDRGELV